MNKSNKQCRNILMGYITFVLVIGAAVLAAGLHAIDKMESRLLPYSQPQAVVYQHVTSGHWQESMDDVQLACSLVVFKVMESLTVEQLAEVPAGAFDQLHQRCLLDNGATL